MASRVPRLLCPKLGRSWVEAHSWSPSELATLPAFDVIPTGLAQAALPTGRGTPISCGQLAVKCSTSRFFMYEEHRADVHAKLPDAQGATEVLAMDAADFFGSTALTARQTGSEAPGAYYYWTSPIADVAPDLLARIPDWQKLHTSVCGDEASPSTSSARRKLPIDPRGPSLWVGSAGSCTQAHYDVADNIIVQLHGTKRVRCYPPSAHEALHVFPDAHPRARKSQVDFDFPDLNRFPNFESIGCPYLDVTLRAGDSLSIPAFWFHHLENGSSGSSSADSSRWSEPSVSLNIFALSEAMMAAQAIFREGRPLEGDGAGETATVGGVQANLASSTFAAAALQCLVSGLINGLKLPASTQSELRTFETPSNFVARLVKSRYAPLHQVRRRYLYDANVASDVLSSKEKAIAAQCVERLLLHFEQLRTITDGDDDANANSLAIVEIVAMHLLELWATALRGAPEVESTLCTAFDISMEVDDGR